MWFKIQHVNKRFLGKSFHKGIYIYMHTHMWYDYSITKYLGMSMMLLNCVVGEDSWESFGLQGDWSWVFFGSIDAEAETLGLWPPHAKSWLIRKDPDAGRDWGQEEKGTAEDEMAGWHHRLDGRESQWTPGVGEGQGGLACCNSCGCKESDTTEWLIWSDDLKIVKVLK